MLLHRMRPALPPPGATAGEPAEPALDGPSVTSAGVSSSAP
jgi:hypothetical protein